ncbi:MAG: DNA repair protein RecN [Oscillospiraceae bacterium]|nr:DNA repair protein RecN [Oscillospiraceae bacterium]
MLCNLHIENIAVIERADVEFSPGFNVLTGETGAGKSMVIDSLDAVLGGRASREIVRHGADKALVSAVFTCDSAGKWFEENEIDEEEEIIIQRRISAEGKSSCRVNGMPVTVQQLRALGSLLLDIHGQNDGRQLLDEARHLAYLDSFGGHEELLADYAESYKAWREVEKEIERLSMDELEKARLTENLRYQIDEIEAANLRVGEEEELSERRSLMKNSGKLTEALEAAYEALYSGSESAVSLASDAEDCVSHASSYAPELSETVKIITDARFMLEDAAERISDMRAALDFSPEEYDEIESRLALLRRLERKYGLDEEAILAHLESCRSRLEEIEFAGDMLIRLEKDREKLRKEILKKGAVITKARRETAEKLSRRVESELKYLSMPSVRFVAKVEPLADKLGFCATGCDDVKFYMSANAGEEPGRISKIASGGELSRIMLAMKGVLAEGDKVESLVFDEIDTGVSGIAAQRVGEKIGQMSARKQVICISHLPQIAAMADCHFSISKAEKNGRTYTSVTELDREGRLRELARLYGGDVVTELTLKSAEEQLSAAEKFKNSI